MEMYNFAIIISLKTVLAYTDFLCTKEDDFFKQIYRIFFIDGTMFCPIIEGVSQLSDQCVGGAVCL
jgi:hypothetical protein